MEELLLLLMLSYGFEEINYSVFQSQCLTWPFLITVLDMLYRYNDGYKHVIHGIIPNSVTHLTLAWAFDQPLEGLVPNSYTFNIGLIPFNQPLKNVLPDTVTHLILGKNYYQALIKNDLPKNLKCIEQKTDLYYDYDNNIFFDFFNITQLKGQILYNYLKIKVFCPKRLNRICNLWNIKTTDYFIAQCIPLV